MGFLREVGGYFFNSSLPLELEVGTLNFRVDHLCEKTEHFFRLVLENNCPKIFSVIQAKHLWWNLPVDKVSKKDFVTATHCVKKSVFGIFVVCIFQHSYWILCIHTPYLSVFITNAGKCGPEKLRIWTLFTQWCRCRFGELFEIVVYVN